MIRLIKSHLAARPLLLGIAAAALGVAACAASPITPSGQGGSGGAAAGTGGTVTPPGSGTGGTTAGTGGSAGGSAGSTGTGGTTGAGGTAGAGAGDAGTGTGNDGGVDTGGFPVGNPGTMGDGDFTIGPTYPGTQPDLMDHGAPKGRRFNFTMSSTTSKFYTGMDPTLNANLSGPFMRQINVYVPAQYKDGTPAAVLVIQDGPGDLGPVQNALDNLTISTDPARKLPVFVAVAVQNGGNDSIGSERGLEYDTVSDKYARFIDEEVLPAVVANAQLKAAYPNFSFTTNPEGRGALGCSSGGAAALTMGWLRPDLFRRLITYSGTFVAQQNPKAPEQAMYPDGAWDYHTNLQLILKTPPKPLRVFVNANEMDNGFNAAESTHHNWVVANQRTAAALKTQNYHYRYLVGNGATHCGGRGRLAGRHADLGLARLPGSVGRGGCRARPTASTTGCGRAASCWRGAMFSPIGALPPQRGCTRRRSWALTI